MNLHMNGYKYKKIFEKIKICSNKYIDICIDIWNQYIIIKVFSSGRGIKSYINTFKYGYIYAYYVRCIMWVCKLLLYFWNDFFFF